MDIFQLIQVIIRRRRLSLVPPSVSIPDGAITTVGGEYITTVGGDHILTVDGWVAISTADTTQLSADSTIALEVNGIPTTIRAEFDKLNQQFLTLYG